MVSLRVDAHRVIVAAMVLVALTFLAGALAALRPSVGSFFLLVTVSAGSLVVLGPAGGGWPSGWLPVVALVSGFSAVGAVAVASSPSLASMVPSSPVGVMLCAAVLSVVLSNDVVVLLLGPLLAVRRVSVWGVAALFVGANVSGGLLPQGSPKNLLLLGPELPFWGFVGVSWRSSVVLLAVAVLFFGVVSLFRPAFFVPRSGGVRSGWSSVALMLPAAVVLQPLADVVGVGRLVLGVFLVLLAVVVSVLSGGGWRVPVMAVPWLLVLVVPVVVVAAAVLEGSSVLSGAVSLVWLGVLLSDLSAGAAGASLVSSGVVEGWRALGLVSASAFFSPSGSVSGLLLMMVFRRAGWRVVVGGLLVSAVVAFVSVVALLVL